MSKLNILDPSGHTAYEWPTRTDAMTLISEAEAVAAAQFEKLATEHYVFTEMDANGQTVGQITEFKPEAEEIVAFRPLQGG